MPTRGLAVPGAIAAAAVAALVVVLSARPAMPPFLPVGDHAAYDAATPASLALVEPVAHAPWFGAASAPAAAVLAALTMAALWAAACNAGGPAAAAIVCAAVLSRVQLRVPLAVGAEATVGLGLLWTSGLLLSRRDVTGREAIWGVMVGAAAVACWPPLMVAAPALAVLASRHGARRAVALLVAAGGGVAGGFALWAARAAALAGEPVSLADVAATVLTATPRGADPFVWPRLTAVTLPVALAGIGSVVLLWRLPPRRRVLLAVAALAPVAAVLTAPTWRDEIRRAVIWSGWPVVGAGVGWVVDQAPPARAWWVAAGVAVLLVTGGVSASMRDVADDERRRFAVALSDALAPLVAASPTTIVAEDTRVDAAVVAWGASAGVQRVRAVPRLVEAAAAGRTVLAGPQARTGLELWGFRFATRARVTVPAPFGISAATGRLGCLPVASPWRELPGLEYSGRLGVHVPAGTGVLELVVIGPPPLAPRFTWPDGRPAGQATSLPMELPQLPPVLWPGDGRIPDSSQVALRFALPAQPDQPRSAALALGQRAPLVAVRYTEPAHLTGVATVCAAPLPRDAADVAAGVPLDDAAYFAGGWHVVERTGGRPFRWTASRAVTLLPAGGGGAVTLVVTARPAAPTPGALTATINGTGLEALAMDPGDREYRWAVPAGVWVEGTNEVVLDVSATARAGAADTRDLGVAVTSLRIVHE